jgi:hypothetical protein
MRIIHRFFWFLSLAWACAPAWAQSDAPPRAPWVHHSLRRSSLMAVRSYDERLAERSFYGVGLEQSLGDRWVRPQAWHEWELAFRGAAMTPLHAENFAFGLMSELNYRYLRRLGDRSAPWRGYLGGEFSAFHHGRWHQKLANSSIHMEAAGSLGLIGQVAREVKLPLLEGPSTVHARLHLPLFSYVGRLPAYALPGFDPLAHYWRPIGGFTRAKTEIGLTRPQGQNNPNLLRVSYVWDFYALNEARDDLIQRLRWGTHSLSVTVLLRKGDLER